jgi:hypothetical protein
VDNHLERGDGMERVRTGLRIPMNLNTVLILEAKRMGISKNALILQVLRDWVKANSDDGKKSA